jgi:hypothetical protein
VAAVAAITFFLLSPPPLREALETNRRNKPMTAATILINRFGSQGAASSIPHNTGERWSFWTAFWTIFRRTEAAPDLPERWSLYFAFERPSMKFV